MIGISLQEGNSERLMFASSFIGSMRCRLITADELISITPLRKEARQFGNNFLVHYTSCKSVLWFDSRRDHFAHGLRRLDWVLKVFFIAWRRLKKRCNPHRKRRHRETDDISLLWVTSFFFSDISCSLLRTKFTFMHIESKWENTNRTLSTCKINT